MHNNATMQNIYNYGQDIKANKNNFVRDYWIDCFPFLIVVYHVFNFKSRLKSIRIGYRLFNSIYSSLINLKKNLPLTNIIFKVESNLRHHPGRQFSHCMQQSPQWSIEVPGCITWHGCLWSIEQAEAQASPAMLPLIKFHSYFFHALTYIAFHYKKCFHWSRKLLKKSKIPHVENTVILSKYYMCSIFLRSLHFSVSNQWNAQFSGLFLLMMR